MQWLLSFLTGGIGREIRETITALKDAHVAKLAAQNDEERIKADIDIAALQAMKDVLVAEQAHLTTRWVRPAFASLFFTYLFKVLIVDKVFGLSTTDPLSDDLTQLMMIVILSYFVGRPLEKVGIEFFRGKGQR